MNARTTERMDATGVPPSEEVTESQPLASCPSSAHQVATRSFGQVWGLHPGMTLLTLVVDTMLFGGEAVSLGTSFAISLAAACVLGFITYRAQMRWYGDDSESAALKAVILAFLTAIPTPLPAFLYVPAGLVGLAHTLRRKHDA